MCMSVLSPWGVLWNRHLIEENGDMQVDSVANVVAGTRVM